MVTNHCNSVCNIWSNSLKDVREEQQSQNNHRTKHTNDIKKRSKQKGKTHNENIPI